MLAAFAMSKVARMASNSPTAASPATGRGWLGVGVGWSSSLTRLDVLMSGPSASGGRDLPDRDGGRVATEGGAEVGLRQVVEGAVVDHRLDALVQGGLVGRALGIDRAVLLTGLVLA